MLLKNIRTDAYIEESILIALCEGWPDSRELKEIYEQIKVANRSLTMSSYYQLMSRKSPGEKFLGRILYDLEAGNLQYGPRNKIFNKCVTRRLKEDPHLQDLFIDKNNEQYKNEREIFTY